MTARYFVDSNVLIYARDVVETAKQRRANDWLDGLWADGAGRLSYQVLIETYSVLTAKRGLHEKQARDYLANFFVWQPLTVDRTVVQRAWQLQDRFKLNWWDSLIVAAAQLSECDYLLTEDLQAGQDFTGLVVVNPFKSAPETR